MPACKDCQMLKDNVCQAHAIAQKELKRPLPPPPSGACAIPIVDSYLLEIKAGMKVLEIGCGTWSKVHDHCKKVGADYDAIDTQESYFGVKSIATRIENLSELSFVTGTFDIVIGNQTMEHWEEFGCPLEWGLYQCFRVCKPGGRVFMNVPIHFHGTWHFMMGKLDVIRQEFERFSQSVEFEAWGEHTAPLPPYFPFPGFSPLSEKPAYVLDVRATRKEKLPSRIKQRSMPKGKLRRLYNYPLSFNIYRVLKKFGLESRIS